jgi:hypothetical protein
VGSEATSGNEERVNVRRTRSKSIGDNFRDNWREGGATRDQPTSGIA